MVSMLRASCGRLAVIRLLGILLLTGFYSLGFSEEVTITGNFSLRCTVAGQQVTIPIAGCRAELWEKRLGIEQAQDELLYYTYTDFDGSVTFSNVENPKPRHWGAVNDYLDVYIKVYPQSQAAYVADWAVVTSVGAIKVASWELKSNEHHNISGNCTVSATATGGQAAAFYTAILLDAARLQWHRLTGSLRDRVAVDCFSGTEITQIGKKAAYDDGLIPADQSWKGMIYLAKGSPESAVSPDCILHEYGHAIHHAAVNRRLPRARGDQLTSQWAIQFSDNWPYSAEAIAFCEGWAEFVSYKLQQEIDANDTMLHNNVAYDPGILHGTIERFQRRQNISNYARYMPAVTAILWDLVDSDITIDNTTSPDDDPINNSSHETCKKIWAILTQDKPDDIAGFWNAWKTRYSNFKWHGKCCWLNNYIGTNIVQNYPPNVIQITIDDEVPIGSTEHYGVLKVTAAVGSGGDLEDVGHLKVYFFARLPSDSRWFYIGVADATENGTASILWNSLLWRADYTISDNSVQESLINRMINSRTTGVQLLALVSDCIPWSITNLDAQTLTASRGSTAEFTIDNTGVEAFAFEAWNGGYIRFANDTVSVTIPAEAFPATGGEQRCWLIYRPRTATAPSGQSLVGSPFSLDVRDAEGNKINYASSDMTIRVFYDPQQLIAAHVEEGQLSLRYYPAQAPWQDITFERVAAGRNVAGRISSLVGFFALMGPPRVSMQITEGPEVKEITSNSAKVWWKTNLPANSVVRLGTRERDFLPANPGYRSFYGDNNVTVHEVTLTGLTKDTEYLYQVVAGPIIYPSIETTLKFRTLPLKPDLTVRFAETPTTGTLRALSQDIKVNLVAKCDDRKPSSNVRIDFRVNNVLLDVCELEPFIGEQNISLPWIPMSAGTYTLKVVVDPYNMIQEFNEDNNERTHQVTITPAVGSIRGIISLQGATGGLEGAKMYLHETLEKPATYETTTDGSGQYRIDSVKEGHYTLVVAAWGCVTYTEPVYVAGNEEIIRNATLNPCGTIYGFVRARPRPTKEEVAPSLRPGGVTVTAPPTVEELVGIQGATVTLQPGGKSARTIEYVEVPFLTGKYELCEVPLGTYTAIASAPGYFPQSKSVILSFRGQQVTLDFLLQEAPAAGRPPAPPASRAGAPSEVPDLVIAPQDITHSPSSPKPKDTVTIRAVVRNIGTTGAAAFTIALLKDAQTLKEQRCSALKAGKSTTVSLSWKVPDDASGELVLTIKVDPKNMVSEQNEDNNQAEHTIIVEAPK